MMSIGRKLAEVTLILDQIKSAAQGPEHALYLQQ